MIFFNVLLRIRYNIILFIRKQHNLREHYEQENYFIYVPKKYKDKKDFIHLDFKNVTDIWKYFDNAPMHSHPGIRYHKNNVILDDEAMILKITSLRNERYDAGAVTFKSPLPYKSIVSVLQRNLGCTGSYMVSPELIRNRDDSREAIKGHSIVSCGENQKRMRIVSFLLKIGKITTKSVERSRARFNTSRSLYHWYTVRNLWFGDLYYVDNILVAIVPSFVHNYMWLSMSMVLSERCDKPIEDKIFSTLYIKELLIQVPEGYEKNGF